LPPFLLYCFSMNGDAHNTHETEINELTELVRQAVALGEENNSLLKKMRRAEKWSTFFRFIYWIIIIGLSVGAFYFIQPYAAALESLWQRSGLSGSISNAGSTGAGSTTPGQSFENTLKNL
jgi:hypothetical protein